MRKLSLVKSHVATDHDAVYRRAWGFSAWAWAALTDAERASYREHVTSAPMLDGAL